MRFGTGNNVKGWEHGNSILGNAIGGVWECVKAREHRSWAWELVKPGNVEVWAWECSCWARECGWDGNARWRDCVIFFCYGGNSCGRGWSTLANSSNIVAWGGANCVLYVTSGCSLPNWLFGLHSSESMGIWLLTLHWVPYLIKGNTRL